MFTGKTTATLILSLVLMTLSQAGSCRGTQRRSPSASANSSSQTNKTMDEQTANKNMSKSPNAQTDSSSGEIWGGDHVQLVMKARGADLEFDCAHGEITVELKTDSEGNFDVPGTFAREVGPTRSDENSKGQPARYVGRITQDTMTLQIHLKDNDQTTETFTLKRGSEGRLWKCR
jgi:hypothetical protein